MLYTANLDNETIIQSKENWIKWFDIYGNHEEDGWKNGEDWFEDMLRNGLIY